MQVRGELDKRYHQALRRFVHDTDGFRSTLRVFQGVVSGSFALRFLRHPRDPFIPRDLDVYVPRGYPFRVAHYLITVEGYSFNHRRWHNPYPDTSAHSSIASVVTLERGDLRIDLVESTEASALYPIASFWGSHLVNFLGADSYCVSLDKMTFRGLGLISSSCLINNSTTTFSEEIQQLMSKYHGRGFRFLTSPLAAASDDGEGNNGPSCRAGAACPLVLRFFGDRFCAVGSISTTSDGTGFARYLVSDLTVAWWRGGDACGGTCQHRADAPEKRDFMSFVLNANRIASNL